MNTFLDLVAIYASSGGTGPFTLGSAVSGFRGTEALTNGAHYSYSAREGDNWEYGTGTYLSTGHLLVRTVDKSSYGPGLPIDFPVGVQVDFTLLASDIREISSTAQAEAAAASAAQADADRVQTGLDRVATHSDTLATAANAASTAADRVQTGLDRTAASTSATAAAGSATAASTSATAAAALGKYYPTRAAAVADSALAVGQMFTSDEVLPLAIYKKATGTPGYTFYGNVPTTAASIPVSPGFTVQDLLDPVETRLGVTLRTSSSLGAGLGGLHVFGIDSLTDGAAGDNWRRYYEAIMRANLGYGGPGFQTFGLGCANDRGATYNAIGLRAEISIQGSATYDPLADCAPGGGGQVLYGAGAYFTWSPEAKWNTARYFYRKGPTLGAFSWFASYAGSPNTVTTVDCYAATVQLAYFDYVLPVGTAGGIRFDFATGTTNPTGPTVLYGGDFALNTKGFRPGNLASGGRRFAQQMAQDATARRAFYAATLPALAIQNLGVNDKDTMDGPTFGTNLTTYVTDLQTAAPAMQINLVQPLQTTDTSTNYIKDYYAQRVSVANTKRCVLVDLRKQMGLFDFTTANAAGYMGDGVHPNTLGDIATARIHAASIGANLTLVDPGKTPYDGSSGPAVKVWSGNLTEKDGTTVTAPAVAASGGTITVAGSTMTVVVAPTAGAYAIGQQICATGLPVGTFILAGSGSSWTLSQSATIASATAATAYTVTRTVLWTLGMIAGYQTATCTFRVAGQRGPTGSAVNQQRGVFSMTNTNVGNTAYCNGTSTGGLVTTLEHQTYSGDGKSIEFLLDVRNKSGVNQVEVGLIPIALNTSPGYGGQVTAQASYIFTVLNTTGQSVIEN